jgi:uncharacterized coiled-coil protein SlyX
VQPPVHNATMKTFCSVVAALAVLALTAAPAHGADSKSSTTYMWIDKNGKKQYGDSVPPEYSQAEKRILNKDGIETRREGPPKTAEQLMEERRQREAVERKMQHDRFLVTTYNSVKDIERLRDERLDQLGAQVTAAQGYIATLDSRLQALQQRAQQFKPYNTAPNARRMPDDLAEQLVRGQSEASAQRKSLERKKQEMADVRAQFDADSVRFAQLQEERRQREATQSAKPG